jgi:hypothetical protein
MIFFSFQGFGQYGIELDGGYYQSKQVHEALSLTSEPTNNFLITLSGKYNLSSPKNLYTKLKLNLLRGGGEIVEPFRPYKTTFYQIGFNPTIGYEIKLNRFSLFLETGVNLGLNFNGTETNYYPDDISIVSISFDKIYKRVEYSLHSTGGIGYEINSKFLSKILLKVIDIRAFSNFYEANFINGTNSTIKNAGWGILLGLNHTFQKE